MSLTVKVIYEGANGSNEIRRFPVNTSAGVDFFIATEEKIKQLYPVLAHSAFTLYWQDPDGDRIAFSSCEEMQEAINYVSDGVLRVFVSDITEPKENSEASTQDQPQQKPYFTEYKLPGPRQNQSQGTQPSTSKGIKVSCSVNDGSGNPQQENCHHNWWTVGGGCPTWDNMHRCTRPNSDSDPSTPGAARGGSEGKTRSQSKNNDPENKSAESSKDNVNKADEDGSTAPDDWTHMKNCEIRMPTSYTIPMPAPPSSTPIPAATTTTAASDMFPKPAAAPQPPTTGPQVSAGTAPPVRPQTNIYPNLQIQQSLDQMLDMGFTDTDGWLIALLTEHNGDIGATLDAIKVKATQHPENTREVH